jgi:RNA polymerase sigma-70 factor, ECF subfamily
MSNGQSVHSRSPIRFADVYRQHLGFVCRSARALGVAPRSIDDVAQEVFLVVARQLAQFEGRSCVQTWLFRIVHNVVRHHRRSIVRKSPHELSSSEAVDANELAGNGGTPYEHVAQAEGAIRLAKILNELDDDKREILVLAEMEEMTVPKIAAALGLKLNTAYSRLRLARRAFEDALERHRARDIWTARECLALDAPAQRPYPLTSQCPARRNSGAS